MAWLWNQTVTILVLITSCCVTQLQGEVIVNATDTARLSFELTSENDFLLAPNGDQIVQKIGDSCSLMMSEVDRYKLGGTDCTANLSILITNVTLQDADIYKTSVSNTSVKLIVLESPEKPNITADKQSYKEGDDLTIVCETISKSQPKDHGITMVYQWYRDGILTQETGESILLTNLQPSDFNITYTCITRDVNGPISAESDPYYLLVEFKGSLKMTINGVENGELFVNLNDTLVFRFTAVAYPLITEVLFNRESQNIDTLYAPNFTKVLTAQCFDNVYFLGVHYHPHGTIVSNRITVKIPCPPTFHAHRPDPYPLYSSPVQEQALSIYLVSYTTFTCQVKRETESGLLPLSPIHDVTATSSYCSVHFRNLDERLYGKYKVFAQNDFGNFTGDVLLAGPPSEPKNLIAWSTFPGSVHLSWEAGDSYGLVPTYRVMFKVDNGQWKEHSEQTKHDLIIIISLLPQTSYSFLVQAKTQKDDYGFYSNLASATTIGIGDDPQPRPKTPDLTSTEKPDHKTTPSPTPTRSTTPTSSPTATPTCQSEALSTGVAIGLAVGIAVAILAVIVTVIVFKKRKVASHYDQPNDTVRFPRDVQDYDQFPIGYQDARGNVNIMTSTDTDTDSTITGNNASQYSDGHLIDILYSEPLDTTSTITSTTDVASPITSTTDVASPRTGTTDVASPRTGTTDVASPITGTTDVASPRTGTTDVASPITGTTDVASLRTISNAS